MPSPLIIATRASPLARAQAQAVAVRLSVERTELLSIVSSGDRLLDAPLAEIGGKGLFTKELDTAVLSGQAHLAVHSCKDLPSALPEGLELACVLSREDPRDVLIGEVSGLEALPRRSRLGGASVRRRAQALSIRPDLRTVLVRGNIGTRLEKLASGHADALLLAAAGLKRLGLFACAAEVLPLQKFLPAPGQGLIAVLIREDAPRAVREACKLVEHRASRLAAEAERAFQARLDGNCRTPIAAHCAVEDGVARMSGEVLTLDGDQRWRLRTELPDCRYDEQARELGESLAVRILSAGADLVL